MKEQDPVAVWNSCLKIIKDNISEVNYKTWFAPVKAVRLKDKALTIEVPSDYVSAVNGNIEAERRGK